MIPNQIVVHHSASPVNTKLTDINAWHKAKFNFPSSLGGYIAYHYVIDFFGKVTQWRRDNELGCHAPPNDGRIGICLIGNFQTLDPTPEQLTALVDLVNSLKKTYNIREVWGHSDCNKTDCPGKRFYPTVQKLTEINRLERWIKLLLMPKSDV